jgi:hypothetical protein
MNVIPFIPALFEFLNQLDPIFFGYGFAHDLFSSIDVEKRIADQDCFSTRGGSDGDENSTR